LAACLCVICHRRSRDRQSKNKRRQGAAFVADGQGNRRPRPRTPPAHEVPPRDALGNLECRRLDLRFNRGSIWEFSFPHTPVRPAPDMILSCAGTPILQFVCSPFLRACMLGGRLGGLRVAPAPPDTVYQSRFSLSSPLPFTELGGSRGATRVLPNGS
jgi:hypothetical protein